MKKYLVSVILVLSTVYAFNQKGPNFTGNNPEIPGSIKGKVLDEQSDVPMEYTSFAIYRFQDSSLVTGTVTNELGKFRRD